MSMMQRAVMKQLLDGADNQLRDFRVNRGVAPRLLDQSISVARVWRPGHPLVWRVDLTATWEDGPCNWQRVCWPTFHWDLAEALIRAGRNAEMFRTKLREKGDRRA